MRIYIPIIILLFLATCVSSQESDKEQKTSCILCKITELAVLVAAPLLILALIGATPFAMLLFVVCGLKWRDRKEDAKKRVGAKRIVIATAIVYGSMAAALIVIGALVLTGVIGGGCGVCSAVQ